MLKKLELLNFQAHKKLALSFGEGLTTIVGATDAGKSAILRALRYVCLNDLSGDSFVRDGEDNCTITLTLDDGTKIRRTKGTSSLYEMDKEQFRAFGTNVPEPIANKLRVTDLNFQSQHDSPFWFAESAGEVSRQLNAVVDLSVIDSALSYLSSQVTSSRVKVQLLEERVETATAAVAEAEKNKERLAQWDELVKRNEELNELHKQNIKLDKCLQAIDTAKKQVRDLPDLEPVLNCWEQLKQTRSDLEDLRQIRYKYLQTRTKLRTLPDLEPALNGWEQLKEVRSQRQFLRDIIERLFGYSDNEKTYQEKMMKAEKKLAQIKGQTCPTCHQTM